MTTDPELGDLLRIHLDILTELSAAGMTGSEVVDALESQYHDPPSRSRVYQTLSELDEAGLLETSNAPSHHKAVQYCATEQGEVRVKEYAAYVGSRVFD